MTFHACIGRCSRSVVLFGLTALLVGCAGRPELLPNSDKSLRLTSAQFAADAAKRHPYKADAPKGGTIEGRAQVGYMADVLEVYNGSKEDWNDVEIWVNKKYVVYVPKIEKDTLKHFTFQMIFDDNGESFPTDNSKIRIEQLEIYKDGKMYDMTTKLAD